MWIVLSFVWAQCSSDWLAELPQWPNAVNVLTLSALVSTAGDDLCGLSDEFEDAATLSDWQRVWEVEGWPGSQLELWDINTTQLGMMTLMPYTSSWYEDLRGVLVFKPVTGDYVVSTRIFPTNRAESAAPNRLYSLGGIFMRAPRNITPQTWVPGDENYIFLSAGSASEPGTFQFEVKTTEDSNSVLQISYVCPDEPNQICPQLPEVELRAARLDGEHFILLRRTGAEWVVHRRYHRADLPETLQVGLTTYTDWETITARGYWPGNPFGHNNTVITDGQPDLTVYADYFRYTRPQIPQEHQGKNFSAAYNANDPTTISDADLLSFLAF